MPGGAPLGNQNAVKAKRWATAIDNALKKRSKSDGIKALDELAEKLLAAAENGDAWAIKELGDRIDGKPAQALIGGDEDDPDIKVVGEITLVKPKD